MASFNKQRNHIKNTMNSGRRSRQRATFYKLLLVILFVSIFLLKNQFGIPKHFKENVFREKSVTFASSMERGDTRSFTTVAKLFLNYTTNVGSQTTTTTYGMQDTKDHITELEDRSLIDNGYDDRNLPSLESVKRQIFFDENNTDIKRSEVDVKYDIIRTSTTTDTVLRNATKTRSINHYYLETENENEETEINHRNEDETAKKDNDDIKNGNDNASIANIHQNIGNEKSDDTEKVVDIHANIIIENSTTGDKKDKTISKNTKDSGNDYNQYNMDNARNINEITDTKNYQEEEDKNRHSNSSGQLFNDIENTNNENAKDFKDNANTNANSEMKKRIEIETNSNVEFRNTYAEKNITTVQKWFENSENKDLQDDFKNVPTVDKNIDSRKHIENNTKNKKDGIKGNSKKHKRNSYYRKGNVKSENNEEGITVEERNKKYDEKTKMKTETKRKGNKDKDEKLEKERSRKRTENGKGKESSVKVVKNGQKIKRNNLDADKHRVSEETTAYGKDQWSNYVKSKYVMHKLMKDDGPKLKAKDRANLVNARCKALMHENNIKLSSKSNLRYDNKSFIFSKQYNLMICINSKVASTNLKRTIFALDKTHTDDSNKVKRPEARAYGQTRMRGFKDVAPGEPRAKFMMVREPLERLVSAYRDKRAYQENTEGSPLTFKKFILQHLHGNFMQENRHIYPYFDRCRPCEVKYDYIGLLHNFDTDVKTMLQKIKANEKVVIPERKKTGYTSVSSSKLLKAYFSKIPNYMIHQLWEKYYLDYYIFGFPYPKHLMS